MESFLNFICVFFCSAAALLLCRGAIPVMTGSHALGVDFRAPETVLIESFRHVSTESYSSSVPHRACIFCNTITQGYWASPHHRQEAPHVAPDILRSKLFRFFNFCTTLSICFLYDSERSSVTPRYLWFLSAAKVPFAVWIFRVSFVSIIWVEICGNWLWGDHF